VAHRAGARLRELAAEREGTTSVVVAHGGVVGASFHALGELPLRQVVGMTRATENTSLTEWALRRSGRWQLVRFNDAAHLRG
jgi:probable phosphoglycerate mutase